MNGGLIKFRQGEADRAYNEGKYTDVTTQIMESWDNDYDNTYEWKPWSGNKGPSYPDRFHRYALSRLGYGFSYSQICEKFNIELWKAKKWVEEFGEQEGYTHEVVKGKLKFTAC